MSPRIALKFLAVLTLALFALVPARAGSSSCCTQEEIDSCYASAAENGCAVQYVGCFRFSHCACAVICPQ
jgi:hypothetical protein